VVSILERQLTYDSVIPLWIRLKIDLIVDYAFRVCENHVDAPNDLALQCEYAQLRKAFPVK